MTPTSTTAITMVVIVDPVEAGFPRPSGLPARISFTNLSPRTAGPKFSIIRRSEGAGRVHNATASRRFRAQRCEVVRQLPHSSNGEHQYRSAPATERRHHPSVRRRDPSWYGGAPAPESQPSGTGSAGPQPNDSNREPGEWFHVAAADA